MHNKICHSEIDKFIDHQDLYENSRYLLDDLHILFIQYNVYLFIDLPLAVSGEVEQITNGYFLIFPGIMFHHSA